MDNFESGGYNGREIVRQDLGTEKLWGRSSECEDAYSETGFAACIIDALFWMPDRFFCRSLLSFGSNNKLLGFLPCLIGVCPIHS